MPNLSMLSLGRSGLSSMLPMDIAACWPNLAFLLICCSNLRGALPSFVNLPKLTTLRQCQSSGDMCARTARSERASPRANCPPPLPSLTSSLSPNRFLCIPAISSASAELNQNYLSGNVSPDFAADSPVLNGLNLAQK